MSQYKECMLLHSPQVRRVISKKSEGHCQLTTFGCPAYMTCMSSAVSDVELFAMTPDYMDGSSELDSTGGPAPASASS